MDEHIKRATELRGMTQLDYVIWISKLEEIKRNKERKDEHRTRLGERLNLFGMAERTIIGDGNCQFNAMSDQLYGHQGYASAIRKAVVTWLRPRGDWNPKKNAGGNLKYFVTTDWKQYCDNMSKSGVWGDHITLLAMAELYGIHIKIISSVSGDEFFMEIDPIENVGKLGRGNTVFLSHWWEYHYCSLTEKDEMAFSITCLSNPMKPKTIFPEPSKLLTAKDILDKVNNVKKPKHVSSQHTSDHQRKALEKVKIILKIYNKNDDDLRRIGRVSWPTLKKLHEIIKNTFGKKMITYDIKYKDKDGIVQDIVTRSDMRCAISHARPTPSGRSLLYIEIHKHNPPKDDHEVTREYQRH